MLKIVKRPGACRASFYLFDIHGNVISEMYWDIDTNKVSIYPAGDAMQTNDKYWEV